MESLVGKKLKGVINMFRCQEYMTQEQQTMAGNFQNKVEAEYSLCIEEMLKLNKAIVYPSNTTDIDDERGINCANREIDSIRKYWNQRLGVLIEFIETKDIKLNEQLAQKYLSRLYKDFSKNA